MGRTDQQTEEDLYRKEKDGNVGECLGGFCFGGSYLRASDVPAPIKGKAQAWWSAPSS
ncbi:MAG: hypothetical protein ACXWMJ_05995 [Syntrophales bacterium]